MRHRASLYGSIPAIALLMIPALGKEAGRIIYHAPKAGSAIFSHDTHGKTGAGYSCTECHPKGASKPPSFTMDDVSNGRACGRCHNGKTRGRRGETAAAVQQCSNCHMPAADIIFTLNRMDPVRFSHLAHLDATRDFSCRDCHPVPFDRASGPIGMEAPHETAGCAHCHDGARHNGRTIFPATTRCLTCHKTSAVK